MSDWLIPLISAGTAAGLSKPVTKFIETVGNAIGVLYEPTRTVKKAEAEAKAAIIKAKASADEQDLIELRSLERDEFLRIRRQRNIESVAKIAYDNLPDKVSEEIVDEDWTVQFFNLSQDIGNEEMQMIWGKILAGEIKKPGSFSMRTLNTVKVINQKYAVKFKMICNYVWGEKYILNYDRLYSFLGALRGVEWEDFLELETLGLLNLTVTWPIEPGASITFPYYGKTYKFTNNGKYKSILSGHKLTQAGIELLNICDCEEDFEFNKQFFECYSKEESGITITTID